MSQKSDQYEQTIAKIIDSIPGIEASRPRVGTDYPDVLITKFNNSRVRVWVEVKMSHTDNLSNPRVFYKDGIWQTTYKTPAAKTAVELLNDSQDTKKFIRDIAKFSGIPLKSIKIPTTKGGLLEEGAVPLMVMKAYADRPGMNRYIMNKQDFNLGKVVTEHYTIGKTEPAYYMQAGDDFYKISNANPLRLPSDIPLLSGDGDFKMRVGTRSDYYEVQAEIKITSMRESRYSLAPGTKKLNPFLKN